MTQVQVLGLSVLSYLLGAIPFSFLIPKHLMGIDVRKYGSGNPGATNVMRACGLSYGLLALSLDFAKGLLPALLIVHLEVSILIAGLAVVGHDWSPFLKFSGGKGVATSLGVLAALSWSAFLICGALWAGVVYLTRYVSVASLTALIVSPLLVWGFGGGGTEIGLMTLLALLAIYRHRSNLERLFHGKEHRIGDEGSGSRGGEA
ncbi:MAG: glycerol-3-phosphate 1-O-acyltransferase PlsY [Candidatus Bipolaricaulia bacterium]